MIFFLLFLKKQFEFIFFAFFVKLVRSPFEFIYIYIYFSISLFSSQSDERREAPPRPRRRGVRKKGRDHRGVDKGVSFFSLFSLALFLLLPLLFLFSPCVFSLSSFPREAAARRWRGRGDRRGGGRGALAEERARARALPLFFVFTDGAARAACCCCLRLLASAASPKLLQEVLGPAGDSYGHQDDIGRRRGRRGSRACSVAVFAVFFGGTSSRSEATAEAPAAQHLSPLPPQLLLVLFFSRCFFNV